jgi:hypothetical protein
MTTGRINQIATARLGTACTVRRCVRNAQTVTGKVFSMLVRVACPS